jgi:hypothetical protein
MNFPSLDHKLRICPCEVTQTLGHDNRVAIDEGNRRRPDEMILEYIDAGLARGDCGQRVL